MTNKTITLLSNVKRKYNEIPIQAKLAIWITFCTVVQKGISVLTVPIFTRVMDTTEYGKVSTYMSWLNIFGIITSFKLGAGVYNKGLSKFQDDRKGFCLAMQYTTSIITLVVYIIYLIFRDYINQLTDLSTGLTTMMFVELFFSTSLGFWTVREQYDFKYKNVVAATLSYAILNPVLGLAIVLMSPYEMRGTARIYSTVLAQVCVGLVFYILNLKNGGFKFKKEYSIFSLKFNLPLLPHYFSEYILNSSDRIMIQKFCSYTQVAFYSVAYNAGMLLTMLTSSINQSITPWLYQQLDKKDFDKIEKILLSMAALIMLPLTVFIMVAPEAILLLAGTEYATAVYVVPPVAGSIIFLFLYTNFANVEFYFNYNKFTMYISIIGAALNIILNYIFIRMFGFIAAGYTTFVCYFVYCLGHFLFVEWILKQKFNRHLMSWKKLMCLFAILTAIMIIMSILYKYTLMRWCIITIIAIGCIWKRKLVKKTLSEFLSIRKGE